MLFGNIGFKYKSISNWESSFYGGFYRTLSDHPYVKKDKKINVETPFSSKSSLPFYLKDKLLDIFLLHAHQYYPNFHELFEEKENIYELSQDRIINVNTHLQNVCSEISSLFKNYEDIIENSKIFIEKPNPNEDKPGSSDEKNSQLENEEGDSDEDNSSEEQKVEEGFDSKKYIEDLLKKIEKVEPRSNDFLNLDRKCTFIDISHYDKKIDSITYSQKNISDAENLVKLLDISFDPYKDDVKNLKIGKLDSSKISEIKAYNTHIYKQVHEEQITKPFTFVILADESGSMLDYKATCQSDLIKTLYLALNSILPKDKLFIYGHSGDYDSEIYTYKDPFTDNFDKRALHLEECNHYLQNYDSIAMLKIYQHVRSLTDDRVIFLSLSDGEPAGVDYEGKEAKEDLKKTIEKCKRDEFVTIGVGIQSPHVSDLYSYSVIIEDLNKMVKDVSNIINRVIKTEFT